MTAPAWTALPWREMVESDGWREAVESHERTVGFRAEMVDSSGVAVADLPVTAAGVSFDGDAAEQWAASLTVVGEEWVPRSPTDPLDPRSGLRCRLWWRLLVDGEWVEVPCGTYYLEDPRISDDGTGPVITVTGRDPLTVLRRAGYGSQVIAVGGMTVPAAISHVVTALSLSTAIRVDSSSSVTLPAVFELTGRDPLDDLTEIAAQAGLIIRTDREGAIIAAPAPEPWAVRADWQEGPDCPVINLDVEIGTSEMVNSVTVVSTSPEVDPPVSATVEDDDPTSPTYVGGPWGRRGLTIRTDAVATVEGAQGLARSTLEGRRRPTEAVEVEVPARPDLGFRDLISLARAASGVGGLYRVAGWTLRVGSAVDAPPTMTVRMMTRSAL